eukprot:TRINITY_DN1238_c0_g1_i2.p1 TRINITY_DN1238_c0_g1~~TRINITY_DN1238_c0_g1_i2.p1  ORF type:complete len:629 (+),score=162.82 TRINITY_DN1238_c0_g1_i2:116-2002(+)
MQGAIEQGCDIGAKDCTGQTPLQVAVAHGRTNVVRLLLDFGADAYLPDSTGRNAINMAEEHPLRHKQKELLKLLKSRTPSPIHSSGGHSFCWMGDMGDDESKHIPDFETSCISTIQEASKSIDTMADKELMGLSQTQSITWTKDSLGLILVMVGLPGRGKTYIARRLCRWLNWKGTGCKIFNVGKYRREVTKEASEQDAAYFDPNDPKAAAEREKLAELASTDLMRYISENPGCVAIFDATNSTIDRRAKLVALFSSVMPSERVIFIESVCTNEDVIHNNILRAKTGNDDYKGKEASYVLEDFKARIKQYEKAYQPLSAERDIDRSWVQLRNTIDSHGGGHITINNVSGHLPTKLLYFLFNLRTAVCPVYLARADETECPGYAAALRRFFSLRMNDTNIRVWATNDRSAKSAIRWFTEPNFLIRHYDSLRERDRGDCRGMVDSTFRQQYPELFREMKMAEYSYAWPRGESYHDLNVRLEQIILDIHGSELPVLIVAGPEALRGLHAYLAEFLPEFCIYLDVPENTIMEVGYKSHNVRLLQHNLSDWANRMFASTLDEECFARSYPDQDPPVSEQSTDDVLPEYIQHNAYAVTLGGSRKSPTTTATNHPRSEPMDIVKPTNKDEGVISY